MSFHSDATATDPLHCTETAQKSGGAFPDKFTWGVAAASYQIEGAVSQDGRGPSIWDAFCRKPGAIWKDQNGDVACDHYNRHSEDIAIMERLGVKAYRMSIAWPRVLPDGTGAINKKGLDFYDRVIDELLAAGIAPWVTLFHWDFPLSLYYRGGWLNRESADWFADYTAVVIDRLSDRVSHWITLNEIQCFLGHGHQNGIHAPGDKMRFAEVLRCGHHSLLAHGRAVQVIRTRAKKRPAIGWAPVGLPYMPATESAQDIDAARTMMFRLNNKTAWTNSWWGDPVMLGKYPEDGLALFGSEVPNYSSEDMKTIQQPLDFYGVNIYVGNTVRLGADNRPTVVPDPIGHPRTAYDWAITPSALRWGPKFLHERYKLPIVITENGVSCNDLVSLDNKIHDPQRIDFTTRYLRELRRAISEGVPVKGYFHWSILDNFEWNEGFKQRLGLVHVDFVTQKRTPKDSAAWYAATIASNGRNL